MGWIWRKEYLDVILVPMGLLIMMGYHLFLLYRYLKLPHTTVIGYENHNKKAWVERIIQIEAKNRGPAVSVISSNISAATSLSSISLALSSLIGAWIGSISSSHKNSIFTSSLIYGDRSQSMISIKYVTLLSCFLLAFGSFVQSTRNFVHANFLISMPHTDIPISYIEKTVIRGSNFWSVGMRALYFATNLLLWLFGPIPMFVSSVIMVAMLHKLDMNSIPLHQYQPVLIHQTVNKKGEEAAIVTRPLEHRGSRTTQGISSEALPPAKHRTP